MHVPVPMRVVSIDGHGACCEARGVRRDVSLALLSDQAVMVGDYVLVHKGYALQTITAAFADATWDIFDQGGSGPDHASA